MGNLFSLDAWMMVWHYKDTFILGFLTTVQVSLISLLISLTLGLIFGLMATSNKLSLQAIARVYVEFIQNTPLLLQICFLYYALSFSGNGIGILASGIISIGLYHGAYMAEVIRAGIQSIHKGQFEAAQSQGFDYFGTMYYIILPQSIKIILPPMVNQVVNLVKNTSCLYIIGGTDLISLTYNFVTGASTGGAYGPAYLVCGLLFFVFCYPLSKLASNWENNLKKRDRMSSTAK
ncbi:MAG: amino acid ABC transporter permease [Succinivibrio sp.]|jgi:putative glutamine transport system permease protein|nr:amino acid ABC transporter permease [Succinivibrio sp.]MBQ8477357.1 amino acid ABC transporter permease [Succinivibrio sp.]MCI5576347.1 amino acid ABC transporter permease [Succinivibrio sp.]MCI5638056.1 amino acid ABC transporter permease [Succinivibrio sp.]MCI7773114.1 amino acid ABC transporter permease [Succinivibrio sp.]